MGVTAYIVSSKLTLDSCTDTGYPHIQLKTTTYDGHDIEPSYYKNKKLPAQVGVKLITYSIRDGQILLPNPVK